MKIKTLAEKLSPKKGKILGIFTHICTYMHSWCGDVLKIEKVKNGYYYTVTNGWKWYDWMLEDKPVNEEKQDVELQNKNDMETKEMTKEEVFEYLNGTKILCTSTKETTDVQEKLFELDIEWVILGRRIDSHKYLLFIRGNKLEYTPDIDFWVRSEKKRIEPNEILAIQIKEDKPKFDPKTLQPFDKVMVRDSEYEVWVVRFFDYYESGFYYTTSSACSWKYCVPYCDETKHLHKTTEEAPEYYKIWK